MAETIEKVELKPIEAVKISHHRSLPPGRYSAIHIEFRNRLYLLRKEGESGLGYIIAWQGKGMMFSDFEVMSDGRLVHFEFDD